MLEVLITLGLGYLAYRAIRGGFQRPQSERLTGYGIVGIIFIAWIALLVLNWLVN